MTMGVIIRSKDGVDVTTALQLTAVWGDDGSCEAFLVKEGQKVIGYVTLKRLAENLKNLGFDLR
jgi:hypothetical protein